MPSPGSETIGEGEAHKCGSKLHIWLFNRHVDMFGSVEVSPIIPPLIFPPGLIVNCGPVELNAAV